MSLRSKTILLFVGLAILPMLILAGFSYWQARDFLLDTAQMRLNQTTERVSDVLDQRGTEVENGLREFATSPEFVVLSGPTVTEKEAYETLPSVLQAAEYLEILRPDGFSKILLGSVPPRPVRTEAGQRSALLLFSAELPRSQGSGTLRAAIWSTDLLSTELTNLEGAVLILESSSGRVLLHAGDMDRFGADQLDYLPELSQAVSSAEETARPFRFRGDGGVRLGAVASAPGRPWVIVGTSSSIAVLADLNRLLGSYWAFVIGLAVSTGLAFSILIGRFTRSLSDLAEAAEGIGRGELAPWLPLPTAGEVGQLSLAFNRMLDRIRKMMDQVDQSGRLAVVGQLSAYFAHEIRNPLTSVKLNLQRMNRWASLGRLPDFCQEPIEISLREVERLSSSVADVLQLSRSEDATPEAFSLHDLVGDSTQLLSSRFERQGVDLRLDLDAEADRVLARPGQVKSVVLNLMINALEAQVEGGFLEIRSELIRSEGFRGPVVAVRFRDGGPGVPPEIRGRVFEPFFTTKPNGSGIGLAVAIRAVAENHGRLYLEPSLTGESGAEFVMAFPLAPVEMAGLGTEDADAEGLQAGPGREWWKGFPRGPFGNPDGQDPPQLMTTAGIEAVMAFSRSDPEEMN